MSERSSQQRKLASVGRSMASKQRELLFLSLGTGGPTPGILYSILGVEILECPAESWWNGQRRAVIRRQQGQAEGAGLV